MIFFFMCKKHELIIDFIFWNDIWYETSEKYSKQNLRKLAVFLKSLSPDKKKLKRSKLAEQPPIHTVLLIFPPLEK